MFSKGVRLSFLEVSTLWWTILGFTFLVLIEVIVAEKPAFVFPRKVVASASL